ncbi:MAG: SurA N-terminal domain-containing protein [Isosphaeraceae bacterium]|nr:SurA N-terminal domain-containing protein [Isosphaeraceae bacterium]
MSARKRGRGAKAVLVAIAAAGFFGSEQAQAQGLFRGKREAAPQPAQQPKAAANGDTEEVAQPILTAIPVNPTDPIATVNNEVITRQQLANECVARKGKEILDTLIARKLIEQALRGKKLEVTAAEIDQEIDRVANQLGGGIGREAWLRTLDKEKGISPAQYARDIIYPALALRKLASPLVQVTDDDEKLAYEAQYGDKVRVRLIMTDTLRKAQEIWEELRKNPGGFERLAQERSMDSGSRSLGGLLAEPISRHAYPTHISDAAFRQLVDGDPQDKNREKPKDGAISGPIQVAEATWVILKREEVIPARTGVSLQSEDVRKQMHEMIYEVKLKEAMSNYYVELMKAARIDNRLVGTTKESHEDAQYAEHEKADSEVKLMGNQATLGTKPTTKTPGNVVRSADRKATAPVGAPTDDVLTKQTEALKQAPVVPAATGAAAPATSTVK